MTTNKPAKKTSAPQLPAGITAKDIETVEVDKLRGSMLKGVYLLEALMFDQAQHEGERLHSLRNVMDTLQGSLFDPDRMSKTAQEGGYALDTKVELLKLARDIHNDKFRHLSELHKNVVTGLEVVKNIDKLKPNTSPLDNNPSKRKAVREARRDIEERMAKRVKELEGKKEKK